MLANQRPWCIGRFVIDRPARSKLSSESYEYWGDEIVITNDVNPGTFQNKVSVRENELRTKNRTVSLDITDEMMRNGDNGIKVISVPWLEKAVSPTPNSRLLIFINKGKADYSFTAEGYVLAGSTMLTMTSPVRPGDIQKSIQLTIDEYKNITYRENWTVPTERGFCVNGALIGGPARNSEVAKQTIVLQPGRPSALAIHMRDAVDVDQQSSLLRTLPDLRKELSAQGYGNSVQIVRDDKRRIAGMDAEEVLFSIREGQMQIFRFYLMAPGNPIRWHNRTPKSS
ncbi:T6SS immunity protein Tli4 family protein [Paraburkholderia steynii]|uniref:T6SS immunity protein Tli4 family protein n=1 Tax=Paraburkholderia steynii TaxID=1245441 RepID=UPI001FC9818B|nr:T6SS immunity protein Tli4 family protein [Paraburkholderia steynii]